MEDTGKRLLLATALCALIMVGFMMFGPKPAPKKVAPAPTAQQVDAGPVAATPAPGQPAPAPGQPAPAPVSQCDVQAAGSVEIVGEKFVATFSECGGALSSWKLTGSQYKKKQADGTYAPHDLVPATDDSRLLPLLLDFPESTVAVDPGARWTLTKKSELEVEASYRNDRIEITRLYTVRPGQYSIDLKIVIKNLSGAEIDQRMQLSLFEYQDPKVGGAGFLGLGYAPPTFQASCFVNGSARRDSVKKLGDEPRVRTGDVRWAGFDHKFFLFAIAPGATEVDQLACITRGYSSRFGMMQTSVRYPLAKVAGGATYERSMMIYGGPKLYDLLETVSSAGGVDARLEESVYLGWFPWLTRPLLSLLRMFHGWVGNWGVAIILLTLFVKLATLYWTIKSSRSMKAMASLKPKMDELRKKYGDDKQRMNVEMMNLYKTHNVNPLSGCLPMLLQMPVWIALYSALNASAELYQAPFVGWLQDLTSPDPYYIVPVMTMGLMFLQQKITPTTIDSAQQRMMMIMMPLTFGIFSLFFPSGLTVYILTNSVLTMVQQIYINKSDPGPKAPAAADAVVAAPAKKDEGGGGEGGGGGAGKSGGGGGKRKPGGGKGRPAKA